ncbi:MAG TPA: hypothetical protein VFV38_34820 [Ktedonobacteraceae bacterium]|nr:hypothetical protein [Ktedonobacteraceae bacterium]
MPLHLAQTHAAQQLVEAGHPAHLDAPRATDRPSPGEHLLQVGTGVEIGIVALDQLDPAAGPGHPCQFRDDLGPA